MAYSNFIDASLHILPQTLINLPRMFKRQVGTTEPGALMRQVGDVGSQLGLNTLFNRVWTSIRENILYVPMRVAHYRGTFEDNIGTLLSHEMF